VKRVEEMRAVVGESLQFGVTSLRMVNGLAKPHGRIAAMLRDEAPFGMSMAGKKREMSAPRDA